MRLPIFIISLVILLVKYSDSQAYSVPEPKVEVFTRGFRVSIPHEDGISRIAFNGNINIPMEEDLETGQYSVDILKPESNHWVFEDTSAEINVGDVLYYWLFVKKFNSGYRYLHGKHVVKNIIQHKPPLDSVTFNENTNNGLSTDKPQSVLPSLTGGDQPISACCQLFLNFTNQLSILSEQIYTLTKENNILLKIAERDDHYATTLKVFGKYNTELFPTPKDFAQHFVSMKLKCFGIKVVEARKIPDNGISFKVETVKDKVTIIMHQPWLEGSNYDLSW